MVISTHLVEVVKIKLEPHPNADSLSIVKVYGYTVCVRTEDWQDGDLGAYIPPDSIIDTTRSEFSFLNKDINKPNVRIRVIKLRGIISMGLLIPAPSDSKEGDNVAGILGVRHYEPLIPTEIEVFCRDNPDVIIYGEIYGRVQSLKYGIDNIRFMAFDTLCKGEWTDAFENTSMLEEYGVPQVPLLTSHMPYDASKIEYYSNGKSIIADHIREGCVIKPMIERTHPSIGRVQLKLVGTDYLAKGK